MILRVFILILMAIEKNQKIVSFIEDKRKDMCIEFSEKEIISIDILK